MNSLVDIPIVEEEWNKTPLSVQAVVFALWEENQVLKQRMTRLQVEVDQLREQVNKNSQNSVVGQKT